jgi:hypothetical protein
MQVPFELINTHMIYSTIDQKWLSEPYLQGVHNCFELVRDHLNSPPKRILDIGAGFAGVSQLFQQHYGTELWLLEGSSEYNATAVRKSKYGTTDSFKFYYSHAELESQWRSQGLQYTLVSAHDPCIPADIHFDLVTSWLSCGYHYPVNTYRDLILAHTDSTSSIIMDFRTKSLKHQANMIIPVHTLEQGGKRTKMQFQYR